jgi:hypothetical protein
MPHSVERNAIFPWYCGAGDCSAQFRNESRLTRHFNSCQYRNAAQPLAAAALAANTRNEDVQAAPDFPYPEELDKNVEMQASYLLILLFIRALTLTRILRLHHVRSSIPHARVASASSIDCSRI